MKALVECKDSVCEKVNQAYSQAFGDVKSMLEDTMKLLRKNISLSARDVADQLGIGRATIFYRLKKLGIQFEDLRKALEKEYEEKTQKKIKRREKKALPPKNYEEFLERDVVKEVVKKLNTASLSERYRNKILRMWFRLCKEMNLAPEDFYHDGEVKKKVLDWLNKKIEEGYNRDSLVSMLQSVQKWLEVQILPATVEQSEYTGKYETAEIPIEIREKIVEDLIREYKESGNEIYLRALKAFAFLFYTGSRSQALRNFVVENEVCTEHPEIVRAYGEKCFILVRTKEKGKKGKPITWHKMIPKSWSFIIPKKYSSKEIQKIRKLLRSEFLKYIDQLNEDTRKYVMDVKKSLHAIRHTAARELLRALRYNRFLTAKILGWKKESNLRIYGDYSLMEILGMGNEQYVMKFTGDELKQKMKELLHKN